MTKVSLEDVFRKDPTFFVNGFKFECDEGWAAILDTLFSEIRQIAGQPGSRITIKQVKEKFGGLRVYWAAENGERDSEIQTLIDRAAVLSVKTCEVCGASGILRRNKEGAGWVKTLCTKHLRAGDADFKPIIAMD